MSVLCLLGGPETADVEALRLENGELQKKNEELEQTVQELKQQVASHFFLKLISEVKTIKLVELIFSGKS